MASITPTVPFDLHKCIQEHPLFSHLSPPQRKQLYLLLKNATPKVFGHDEVITNVSYDSTPYLIVRGRVTIHIAKDERSARLAQPNSTLTEGDIIGFSHIVGHNPWATKRVPISYGKDAVAIAKSAVVDNFESDSATSSNRSSTSSTKDTVIVIPIPEQAWPIIATHLHEFSSSDFELSWNLSSGQLSSSREDTNEDGARVIRIAFYDAKPYMRQYFISEAKKVEQKYDNSLQFNFKWIDSRVSVETAPLAANCPVACTFVNDQVTEEVTQIFAKVGVKMIALRAAGFNSVNIGAADKLNISVARVPAYSPYAVAEFATTLLMAVNRKVHHAYNRTRDYNFSLNRLVGSDMHGKTVGVIGTGKIGQCFINIMLGFGCKVLAYDVYQSDYVKGLKNVTYTSLEEVFKESDAISLHVPLLKETKHFINAKSIAMMKPNCILINTGRGALINTHDLIQGLQQEKLAGAGLDVYEEEDKVFFEDFSDTMIQDNQLIQLVGLPNVILTSHQAFLTAEALTGIANTTLENIHECIIEGKTMNELKNTVNKKSDKRKQKSATHTSNGGGSGTGSVKANKTHGRMNLNEHMISKL